MPTATAAHTGKRASGKREGLRCRVRLADGRSFAGELPPERHRSLQIGMLHENGDGLVELAAGARRDGRLQIATRRRADHFLPGGSAGEKEWLKDLLDLAARHAERGEEVFLAPAVCSHPAGEKQAVTASRWLCCGSTSISQASCTRCGRSWPSARATCWWSRAAPEAFTRTGSSSGRSPLFAAGGIPLSNR